MHKNERIHQTFAITSFAGNESARKHFGNAPLIHIVRGENINFEWDWILKKIKSFNAASLYK
jgi:hypothetical protein